LGERNRLQAALCSIPPPTLIILYKYPRTVSIPSKLGDQRRVLLARAFKRRRSTLQSYAGCRIGGIRYSGMSDERCCQRIAASNAEFRGERLAGDFR
jgi:hypothetical protein